MVKLSIPLWRWMCLMADLRRCSGGRRESGAFLLGRVGGARVIRYVVYHALDPHVSDSGVITFNGSGFFPLWTLCSQQALRVLADVHTHPTDWTGQSSSDRAQPMVSLPHHIALIVPFFAARRLQGLRGVGIHEYLGNRRWKTWEWNSGKVRLVLL
jgi:proteasome lid subunit RPN8/RPN11